jgi:hypothetical protein
LLMLFAALLEVLQGLTSDRVPDLPTALSGAGGVLAAALLAQFIIYASERGIPPVTSVPRSEGANTPGSK